jgi:hypothetical protein
MGFGYEVFPQPLNPGPDFFRPLRVVEEATSLFCQGRLSEALGLFRRDDLRAKCKELIDADRRAAGR